MKKIVYILSALLFVGFQINAQTIGWSELGGLNGLSAGNGINSVCSDPSGNIYAAGYFDNTSGKYYVAKYNGSTWSELGGLNGLAANGVIYSICSDNEGNIYAAGSFTNSSGKQYVAKYNGTSWSELGGLNGLAANHTIYALCTDAARNVYAAGIFTVDTNKSYVAIYDGTAWGKLGGLDSVIYNGAMYTLCSDARGNIYTAGQLNPAGLQYVAEYNGAVWSQVGSGVDGVINTICTDPSGNLYEAGDYKTSDNGGFYYVQKYDSAAGWAKLGGNNGFLTANAFILSICSDAEGNIYAAGDFTNEAADTSGHKYVAKYNGTAWSELGGLNGLGANGSINSICTDAAGNIYAGGYFRNASNSYYVAKYGAITGINEIATTGAMNLFPNPTNNTVTVSTGNTITNASIKVYNITGQVVGENDNETGEKFMVDLSNQSPGMYFVEVRDGENVWVGKVVRE